MCGPIDGRQELANHDYKPGNKVYVFVCSFHINNSHFFTNKTRGFKGFEVLKCCYNVSCLVIVSSPPCFPGL